jgi:hypothetical protein
MVAGFVGVKSSIYQDIEHKAHLTRVSSEVHSAWCAPLERLTCSSHVNSNRKPPHVLKAVRLMAEIYIYLATQAREYLQTYLATSGRVNLHQKSTDPDRQARVSKRMHKNSIWTIYLLLHYYCSYCWSIQDSRYFSATQ